MTWDEVMNFMDEHCEACGCLLNNSPGCDPNLNGGTGCAHRFSRILTCPSP